MNENKVIAMVKPYIKDNELTYDEFDQIFSMLSLHEQYSAIEVINKNGIELVDEHKLTFSNVMKDAFDDKERSGLSIEQNPMSINNKSNPTVACKNEDEEHQERFLLVRNRIDLSNKVLAQMIQEGDMQAKQDLCIKNQRLVDKYVNAYLHVLGNKLDFEDLEQAGMIGMLTAAERYDINANTEFSTYAVWWIKQAISREIIDNGYTIRIPVHKMEQIQKVTRLNSEYLAESDYHKRIEMISSASGLSEELVEECLQLSDQFVRTVSLDLPVGENEDTPLTEMISYLEEQSTEDLLIQGAMKEQIKDLIDSLRPREQQVIRLRFGFDDGRERTLEEVGKELGVTRERIRQIETKALNKLKHPTKRKKLKDYLI